MNVRLINESEKDRYNEFVANGPKGHILQSFEWGEIKARTGWEPFRLVAEDGGQIRAALSILKRRLPIPGRSIFYAPRGPVVDLDDRPACEALLGEARRLASTHGAIMLKIDPDWPADNELARKTLASLGFRTTDKGRNFEGVQPKFVFRLSLEPEPEAIFNNFHQKTRYNIRLAAKKGVSIRVATREDLPVFYKILLETAKRDRFMVRSYEYFEDLWRYLVERNMARLFMADYEGQAIAGTLAFNFGDKAWYIYGASSNRHRDAMPNYLLQWEMIQWAKGLGCRMYDFRGVSGDLSPDNPLYGLFRFKKGFGGDFTEFVGEYDLVYSPAVYWAWVWGEPLARRTMTGLARLKRRAKPGPTA